MYNNRGNDRGDRGNRPRFGAKEIPVKEGEIIDVEIISIGEKGDGIAKLEGYVIIVPNTKKGDKIKVKINAVRGRVSFGEAVGKSEGGSRKEELTDDEEETEGSAEGGSDEDLDSDEDAEAEIEEEGEKEE